MRVFFLRSIELVTCRFHIFLSRNSYRCVNKEAIELR